jgi:NAD/NADP transhydrogenase beta subunit
MGRAMNRSIGNVLFGAFAQVTPQAAAVAAGDGGATVRSARSEVVCVLLRYGH